MGLLEIACFTPESALAAWGAGADRIEICADQAAGGVTPSLETIVSVKRRVNIPVFVMIRPRGGDFNFSEREFQVMEVNIERLKTLVDGFVFGILDESNNVDISRTARLVKRASPRPCTFHRAFDEVEDQYQGLEDVITTGCRALLTSGGARNAVAGAQRLRELVGRAGSRIAVMPGGGVRSTNIGQLHVFTRAQHFHSSAINSSTMSVDVKEVQRMKAMLRQTLNQTQGRQSIAQRPQSGYTQPGTDSFPAGSMSAVSTGTNTPAQEPDSPLE
jgi:copper homeostasis protein